MHLDVACPVAGPRRASPGARARRRGAAPAAPARRSSRERRLVKADVARVGAGQQAGAEHERAERQRGLRRRAGSASAARSGPTARRPLRDPGRGPRAIRRTSPRRSAGIVGVQAHQRERRPRGARALGDASDAGSGRARRPRCSGAGSEPRRSTRRRGARASARGSPAAAAPHEVRAAEPREQRPVGHAAAQEHVLAVVHLAARRARTSRRRRRAGAAPRRASRCAPASAQSSAAVIPARPPPTTTTRRSALTRPPPSSPAPPPTPSRAPAATCACASAPPGVGLDALEQPPVDAGHRQHAGGAAPVEQRA